VPPVSLQSSPSAPVPARKNSDAALPYAEGHDWIYTRWHPSSRSQGGHPGASRNSRKLAQHPKVIAWGEIGLDYFYDHSRATSRSASSAGKWNSRKRPSSHHHPLPRCWSDCLRLLEEVWKPTALGGVLHCFTSTLEDAKRGLDMGFMISFTGNLTYPKCRICATLRKLCRSGTS